MAGRVRALEVNGSTRAVDVDGDRSLLSVLRDVLNLAGAKYGCGEGRCGACTVLVEGEPVHSCLARVEAVVGKAITTIEGLEHNGRLHPLQQAFLDEGALQCGYCTPGMIVAGAGFLAKTPQPDDTQILSALAGHICRCGTYPRIVAAVHRAARAMATSAAKGGDQ